jgi:hypothetical protein
MQAHDNIDKLLMLQALQTVEPVSTSTAGYLYPQPEQKGSFLRDMLGFVTDIGVDSGELDWRKLPLYLVGLGLTVGGGGKSRPFKTVKMMSKAEPKGLLELVHGFQRNAGESVLKHYKKSGYFKKLPEYQQKAEQLGNPEYFLSHFLNRQNPLYKKSFPKDISFKNLTQSEQNLAHVINEGMEVLKKKVTPLYDEAMKQRELELNLLKLKELLK